MYWLGICFEYLKLRREEFHSNPICFFPDRVSASSLPMMYFSICVRQVFDSEGSAAKDYIFERKVRGALVIALPPPPQHTTLHPPPSHPFYPSCSLTLNLAAGWHHAARAQRAQPRLHRLARHRGERGGHRGRRLWVGAARQAEVRGPLWELGAYSSGSTIYCITLKNLCACMTKAQ